MLLSAALALLAVRPAAAATPVRIMPLGDSITGSPGCWRALLWNRLQSNGFTDIDFVGTLPPQGCGIPYDGDNEGHGGFLATNVANQNLLPGWLAATHPDIVMMHFGTNDVWNNIPPATILAAFSTLVDQMRASNPNMTVLVAQIIPMNPSNCAECGQRVVNLNNAIPAWAAAKSTAQSPIVVVDQWTGFSTATDTYDGVHPNDSGNQKMSDRWYPALSAALSGITPSPSPTTASPITASPTASRTSGPPSSSPPAPGGCTATYRIVGQWPGGFQGEVTVRNSGTAPISGWSVGFTFANGQRITQYWGTEATQSGAAVTAVNVSWNGSLAPNAATTFGFLASWAGTNTAPTPTCT
ncbi:MAG: cellulose binding domain-containing protein, partial [Micromonosporaceae bacterium]|nr:cellulose binding domain-containing protein [Micromonosporaceae bacterium]